MSDQPNAGAPSPAPVSDAVQVERPAEICLACNCVRSAHAQGCSIAIVEATPVIPKDATGRTWPKVAAAEPVR